MKHYSSHDFMCITTGTDELFTRIVAEITELIEQNRIRYALRDKPGYNKAHKYCATVINEDNYQY